MWHTVDTQEEIELLMNNYGNFHDSCIVSVNYQSGAFVDDKMAMHFGDAEEHILSVVFHRQWALKTIELQFIGLRQCHLVGWEHNCFCDIFSAYLAFSDNLLPGNPERLIIWSDYDGFETNKIENAICEPADTYIVANTLRWRFIDEE